MDRRYQLNTILGLPLAIKAINKVSPHQLTEKELRVLIGLQTLCIRGAPVNRMILFKWLHKVRAIESDQGIYFMFRRIVHKGYIEQDGQGYGAEVRLSLSGRNYISAIERYLRQMRLNEL